jgi:hypothetical protein
VVETPNTKTFDGRATQDYNRWVRKDEQGKPVMPDRNRRGVAEVEGSAEDPVVPASALAAVITHPMQAS